MLGRCLDIVVDFVLPLLAVVFLLGIAAIVFAIEWRLFWWLVNG